jgi:hypothetical protein
MTSNTTPIFILKVFLVSLLSLPVVSGLSSSSSSSSSSRSTVLYGPAARELLLLTAKLAAREGLEAACVCSPGTEESCRRLMYGDGSIVRSTTTTNDDDDNKDNSTIRARPVSTGEEIAAALQAAQSIIFVGYDQPIDEKSYNTLLNSAGENLSKVVLLSKIGVSQATKGGGFFGGGGGGNGKLLQSETMLRELCKSKNLGLSIVRAGILKGGGPGENDNDFGLAPCYYNTLLDIVEASVTMAHDKYTLGLDCRPGDTIQMPNIIAQMSSKSSFEACPYDTNRIVVAGGLVAAALSDAPVEVTVSAAKGREPPTLEAWTKAFASSAATIPVA